MKSILLLTHDTSLSGAPKSILLVFEQLVKKGINLTTLAITGGGELEERFQKISNNYYRLDTIPKNKVYSFASRLKRKLFGTPILSAYESFIDGVSATEFDFIYCNTIVSLQLGLILKEKTHCKLILHVHELKTVIDEFCPLLKDYDAWIDVYIVPSELNKKCLVENYTIPPNKIHVIRETSDFKGIVSRTKFSDSTINVLMCGGAYWRKGDDLFVLIANAILKKDKRFRFHWVGHLSNERKRVNEADITKLGIKDFVHFIDETKNPLHWFLQSDLFMLTSREDPFPLAAIEAGMIGLPIFCFDQATGIAEVIDTSCVIPYLDIEQMSERILSVVQNDLHFAALSTENKMLFSTYTPEHISSDIMHLIQVL
jgi:glycosyltransferase involved in cell wall biosynthesis